MYICVCTYIYLYRGICIRFFHVQSAGEGLALTAAQCPAPHASWGGHQLALHHVQTCANTLPVAEHCPQTRQAWCWCQQGDSHACHQLPSRVLCSLCPTRAMELSLPLGLRARPCPYLCQLAGWVAAVTAGSCSRGHLKGRSPAVATVTSPALGPEQQTRVFL